MNLLTYTDIANMAIDWCGGSLSIDDIENSQNPDAILCKRNLPIAIKSELDKYEWSFGRKIIELAEYADEDSQIKGYHCYLLPNDFSRLSMYRFFDDYKVVPSEYMEGHSYFIQQNKLYTKFPLTKLTYQSNDVDIKYWHSLFCDIVSLNLAQRIAGKIKGMDADIGFINSLYKEKLKDARRLELITTEAQQGGESVLQLNRIVP